MSRDKKRILLVDDNKSIHDDLKHILYYVDAEQNAESLTLENELFNERQIKDAGEVKPPLNFRIDDAYQGEEAIKMVDEAARAGYPYCLIFMDVRMPPGIDGIQTIQQIWEKHPFIEMVICTAFSDYSWEEILKQFGPTDHLLFIKKPFDSVTVRQMSLTLTTKWDLSQKNLKHRENLEKEVKIRTGELHNIIKHLTELKDEAEESMLAKNKFLRNMRDEIRRPLSGIMGITDLLLNMELKEEQRSYLEIIKFSSDSIFSLVNNFLDFAKTEAGAVKLKIIDFNLRSTVDNVVDFVSISAREKGIAMASFINADIPQFLRGDPERIRQIILNLCNNAVKFTSQGEIFVSVFPELSHASSHGNQKEENGLTVRFEVSDTGIGLSEELQKKILDPFSQNGVSAAHNEGGSGMGLAVSKMLCELMGGEIGVQSKEGEGSTFWFTVKFKTSLKSLEVKTPSCKNIKNANVLVLGDNATSRKVLSLYIKHWGGICAETDSLPQALKMLREKQETKHPYEIVIIDFRNGHREFYAEAASKIRQDNSLKKLSLICLTSSPKRGDAQALQEMGYDSYLTEPIKQSHLFNTIAMLKDSYDEKMQQKPAEIITKHLVDEIFSDKYRFLVADGDVLNQKVLAGMLKKIGIRIDVTRSGEEAVTAVAYNKYDGVFLGCMMPGIDQYETARQIRENEKDQRPVPVIGIMANTSQETQEKCINAGMDGYLSKPFATERLLELLKKILDSKQEAQE